MSKRERTRLLTSLAIAIAVGFCLVIAHGFRWFTTIQQTSHDIFYRGQKEVVFGDIPTRYVIVAIDNKSLAELGRWTAWDRTLYARLIDTLKAANAREIVFDVGFFEPAPGDEELARAIRDARDVVQPLVGMPEDQGGAGLTRLRTAGMPRAELLPGTALMGAANVIADGDGSVRTIPLAFDVDGQKVPSLSLAGVAVALRQDQSLQLNQSPPVFRFAGRDIPVTERVGMRVNYVGPPSFPEGPQTFKTVSIVDAIEGRVDPATFDDKRIFVGLLGAQGFADDYWTPVSTTQTGKMAGVEIHVNAAATLEKAAFITPENPRVTIAIVLLFAVITGFASARFGIVKGLGVVIGLALLYLAIAGQMFDRGQLVNLVYPLLALALPYAGTATYYVVFEERHARFLRGAMGRYLSPSVMEEIVLRPELLRLGGEKRDMTVMFSDIRGFTSFAEELDPQELVTLLNEYLTAMTNVIYRHDGVLDKYMGDAIMAFWNGPVSQPDHARRGCLAGLDMLQTLKELHERWSDRGIPPLNMGVGVNTGAMSVGNMGSDTRFDYTVMGDAVNLASRLEGTNKEYATNIVISQMTLDEVKSEGFVVRFLDLVTVKGKAQPVAVYELIGRAGEFGPFTPELLDVYERGIYLYRRQRFAEAEAAFQYVLTARGEDGPAAMYLERCAELTAAPPPPDWDGVYVMTHK